VPSETSPKRGAIKNQNNAATMATQMIALVVGLSVMGRGKKGLPKDPWSNAYVYRMPGSHNANAYDLFSAGPDKQEGTEDDVTNWSTESPL